VKIVLFDYHKFSCLGLLYVTTHQEMKAHHDASLTVGSARSMAVRRSVTYRYITWQGLIVRNTST